MRIQLVLVLPREAASVPLARHTVSAALRGAQVDPDCLAEVEVAFTEACTAVLRAAGHDENYEVLINLGADRLTVDVLDVGAGFGRRSAVAAQIPGTAVEAERGQLLMKAFSDRAIFDSVTGEGSSVHLVKQLRWAEADSAGPRDTSLAAGLR